jgi:hypothetical protein
MERVGRPLITVGLTVAAIVLVAVVATGGHVPLATEGSGGWRIERRELPDDLEDSEIEPFDDQTEPSRRTGEGAVGVLAQTALVAAGGIVLFLIGRAIVRMSRRETDPLDAPPEEHWPDEPPGEMVAAVDDGLDALAVGPVDDVIIACWVRLEDAAEAAGVGRRPAETSAELAARVLETWHAPSASVSVLLDRYRQARYSHHPLDEDDRAAAVAALSEIRSALAGAQVS